MAYYSQPGFTPPPAPQPLPRYPVGKRELVTGLFLLIFGLLMTNSILYGGFNLGFSVSGIGILVTVCLYLYACEKRMNGYVTGLFSLSLAILAGFSRSDDGFVKFVMICFLFVGICLFVVLTAGQNRRDPKGFSSLADAFRGFFMLGFGGFGSSFRGLGHCLKNSSSAGKKSLSVLLGLAFAVPLLLILIPLLMRADAAFEGIIDKLPDIRLDEILSTLILGGIMSCLLFSWAVSHIYAPAKESKKASGKGLSSLTVNTVLIAVALVYCVYLVSQLAYFSGGFLGLLPEGYSTAEYARRGFFEMAWLCAINLTVMVLAAGLVKKAPGAPLSTRLLCLAVGLVTLFLVVTASAKMGFYIRSYGLTRLRVLTEVIMVFLGLTTAIISVWLFAPKLAYMKAILLTGLAIGALVIWADVDTVVARYNVGAYRNGQLESVDAYYLSDLGDGAVPYLAQLMEDSDPALARLSAALLDTGRVSDTDIRGWNWCDHVAQEYYK